MSSRFTSTDEAYAYRVSGDSAPAAPVVRTVSVYLIEYAEALPGTDPKGNFGPQPKFGYLCLRAPRTDGLTGHLNPVIYEYGVEGWGRVSSGSPWIAGISTRMEGMEYGFHRVVVTL